MRRLYAVLFTLVAVASAGLPAQANPVDSLAPGHWYKVPNSHLQDVALQPVDPQLYNIIDSWGGGAFDTKRHRLIVWGGGHADYWGNEIYTFNVDTLKWQRINDPYPAKGYKKIYNYGRTGVRINPINPDGTPDSRHTYDNLVYLPKQDRFWMTGGAIWPSAAGTSHAAEFNFDTLKWKYKTGSPHWTVGVSTAYDPVTGNIFEQWCDWVMEYNPVENTWTTRDSDSCIGNRMVGEIDPVNRKFVVLGGGRAVVYNITPSGWMSQKPLNAVGPGALVMKNAFYPGLVYDRSEEHTSELQSH